MNWLSLGEWKSGDWQEDKTSPQIKVIVPCIFSTTLWQSPLCHHWAALRTLMLRQFTGLSLRMQGFCIRDQGKYPNNSGKVNLELKIALWMSYSVGMVFQWVTVTELLYHCSKPGWVGKTPLWGTLQGFLGLEKVVANNCLWGPCTQIKLPLSFSFHFLDLRVSPWHTVSALFISSSMPGPMK